MYSDPNHTYSNFLIWNIITYIQCGDSCLSAVHFCRHAYVCACVGMHIYVQVQACIYVCACVGMHMYVQVQACICMCMCMHAYIYMGTCRHAYQNLYPPFVFLTAARSGVSNEYTISTINICTSSLREQTKLPTHLTQLPHSARKTKRK